MIVSDCATQCYRCIVNSIGTSICGSCSASSTLNSNSFSNRELASNDCVCSTNYEAIFTVADASVLETPWCSGETATTATATLAADYLSVSVVFTEVIELSVNNVP